MRKFDNKNLVLSAIITKLLSPSVRVWCILKNDERSFGVDFTPLREDPSEQHMFQKILVVAATFSGKNSGVGSLEVVSAHTRQVRHSASGGLSPF